MIKKFIYATVLLASFSITGCIDDFGDTNVNPNATTTPIYAALLTNAEASVGGLCSNDGNAIRGALYGQYFSETQYTEASLYSLPQQSFTGYYSGPLND